MLKKNRPVKQRRTVWVAIRYDGKYWRGEYHQFGNTFVNDIRAAYLWGSLSACLCAISNTHYNQARHTVDTLEAADVRYKDTL